MLCYLKGLFNISYLFPAKIITDCEENNTQVEKIKYFKYSLAGGKRRKSSEAKITMLYKAREFQVSQNS